MVDFELAIVGGGITGAGLARDAAGRGVSVLLLEQNDLASGTSSASTKLIHGGLRYLEQWQFGLVAKSLAERETLMRIAPHVIWPLRFVLPHHEDMRSAWMLRLGLFIYDRLGGRTSLPGTRVVDLTYDPVGVPLKRQFRLGFEYSDCWVDDARLVVLNAMDAAERGAVVRTRTRLARAERERDHWRLTLYKRGQREITSARVLVNAAGPWVDLVAETVLRLKPPEAIRLVKGSHVVFPRLFDHDRAYIFQHVDGRVVFAIPFERDFTLIGTTDEDFVGNPAAVAVTPQEVHYLCQAVNRYFRLPVSGADIIWSYAGVRPLHDRGEKRAADLKRDYAIELDAPPDGAPLLTIYGGKITTYRRLAEMAYAAVARFFGSARAWTASEPLPGGNFGSVEELVAQARERRPFLSPEHARRLIRAYGTRIDDVLGHAGRLEDLGPRFGRDLTGTEVDYLIHHEWAQTADDILWRRSKLGLHLSPDDRTALEAYVASASGRTPPAGATAA